jgi:hypothetical protein
MCVAADSNALVKMQVERLALEGRSEGPLAEQILSKTYLALHLDGHCLQETCNCLEGPFTDELQAWLMQLENDGKLRRLEVQPDRQFQKKLREAGLPKKDWKWAQLARHDCVTTILTEDIDFYEPKDKSAKNPRKESRKNNRTGTVLKLLKKEANADVISARHVEMFFCEE